MTTPKITHPALYRAIQFFAALKASLPTWAGGGLTADDQTLVAAILTTPAQRQLFNRMPPNDQRHAVAVARTLQQAGYTQPALLQAALLHDVAKSLGQPIIYRVLIVLLETFWPAGLEQITNRPTADQPIGHSESFSLSPSLLPLLHPFMVHAHHPAMGAAWAKTAICEPLAVSLIARHQEILAKEPGNEEENLLAALQWADNLN